MSTAIMCKHPEHSAMPAAHTHAHRNFNLYLRKTPWITDSSALVSSADKKLEHWERLRITENSSSSPELPSLHHTNHHTGLPPTKIEITTSNGPEAAASPLKWSFCTKQIHTVLVLQPFTELHCKSNILFHTLQLFPHLITDMGDKF